MAGISIFLTAFQVILLPTLFCAFRCFLFIHTATFDARQVAYFANYLSTSTLGDKCSVTCLKNNMVIAIPKPVLRGADREHIRALDVNCKASENLTVFILDVPLTGCGTRKRHAVSSVVYTNEALPIPAMAKDVVSHVPNFQIPFHCYYDNDGLVSGIGLKPFSKKIIFSKKGFGKFALRLDLFPDIRSEKLMIHCKFSLQAPQT